MSLGRSHRAARPAGGRRMGGVTRSDGGGAMPGVCPGQSTAHWKFDDIYDLPCVACGRPVEFFKIDVKRKCPHCSQVVMNPRMDFACAEWCAKAEECLGPLVYGEFMEKKRLEETRKAHFEQLL